MNAQELIAKYEQEKEDILHYQNSENWKSEGQIQKSQSVAVLRWVHDFIEDLKKLDESKKVEVPKYVAELFDYYRNSTDVDLLALLITFKAWYSRTDKNGKYEEAIDWLVKHPEKFMRAWLDGYEVEKKPKWVILGKRGYLTSLSIGKGKSTGWTGNSDKYGSGAIHFEEEDIAQYTAYIVNGEVEPVEVPE